MQSDWRDPFLRALVVMGAMVGLVTEGLGALNAIRPWPLPAAWIATVAIAGWIGIRRYARPKFFWPGLTDALLLAAIGAILAITAAIALLSPPNSSDAMAYHMPRVVYWSQQASVRFFPTSYYNQLMLQPLAEYFMLHTFVLSGGDRFINLVQWLGSVGCVVGVSAIAERLGASRRGQIVAALFSATLPNGILQATGAKNDYMLAMWLVAMAYFAMRENALFTGLALACALMTKATAYLFAPPLLLVIWLPAIRRNPKRMGRAALIAAVCILMLNGPQYWRNIDLSGSPMGFDSAQGDGVFRWRNEPFGVRQTLSNVLRHFSDQLGGRSEAWNRGVYDWVVRAHAWIGIHVDDPGTTWPGTKFEPPRNANHETNAPNRWHLLLLVAVLIAALWRRSVKELSYAAALVTAFLLFCFYLKWQPFMARMLLPLFVLASPLAGAELARLRPQILSLLICLLLVNNSRPFLFENWIRPLKGPRSVLRVSRDDQYFADMTQWDNKSAYLAAVQAVRQSGCGLVGVDINDFTLEYPLQALLRESNPGIRFIHTDVRNTSIKYSVPNGAQPCVEVHLSGTPAAFTVTTPK